MSKPIHSMIRVVDEARSRDYYTRAFGLEPADRFDFPDFTLLYLRDPSSPFELELTVNKERSAPYDLGDGYGHLAFVVDDVEAEHARHKEAGFTATDLKELKHDGKVLGKFFFATDPDGYKIEVLQKGGRFG